MANYAVIFISACLVNNLILDYLLGVSPAVAVSRKIETAAGMGAAIIFTLTIAALVSYPVKLFLLVPFDIEHLETISLVLIVTLSILLGERCLQKFKPAIHARIAVFIPLTLVNCSALGVALLNVQHQHGLPGSLFFGLGSGIGFSVVIMMLAAMQERIEVSDIPGPFQGVSILLITLGIISMAFMGFIGMVSL